MVFHVTQCPGCESTFNTNARLLQSAAGKVRCGACLTVFEAADNFLQNPDAMDDAEANESVFIGNNPADYFNPSLFLTRSALTAPDDSEIATKKLPTTKSPAIDRSYAQSVTPPLIDDISAEFLAKVSRELEASRRTESSDAVAPEVVDDPEVSLHPESYLAAEINSEPDTEFEADSDDMGLQSYLARQYKTQMSEPVPPIQEPDESGIAAAPGEMPDDLPDELSDKLPDELSDELPEPTSSPQITELSSATTDPDPPQPIAIAPAGPEIDSDSDIEDAVPTIGFDMEFSVDPLIGSDETLLKDEDGSNLELDLQFSRARDFVEPFILETEADSVAPDVTSEPQSAADDASIAPLPAVDTDTSDDGVDEFGTTPEPDPPIGTASEAPDDELEEEESTEVIRARALHAVLEDEDALEALPAETRSLISKALPPLEFFAMREGQWGRKLALALSCLLLAAILAAQFLWQRLPVFSQLSQIRPLYEVACSFLGCDLPVYSEITAIRNDNLLVRTHPEVDSALRVSLSFRNTARFPQPFPILILSFNSTTNAIIALREFAPSEYLDQQLQVFELMPVDTPVQVNLDIMDPGPDAVNYTVAFRRP